LVLDLVGFKLHLGFFDCGFQLLFNFFLKSVYEVDETIVRGTFEIYGSGTPCCYPIWSSSSDSPSDWSDSVYSSWEPCDCSSSDPLSCSSCICWSWERVSCWRVAANASDCCI